MAIKAGERMPAGKFKRMTKEGPKDLTTDELFKGKTVVLFSVPGAFTPTCDAKHLPGFVQLADPIRAKGVDAIACMAVNDVFVMNAWGKAQGVGDKVLMLAEWLRDGHAWPALRHRGVRWRRDARRGGGAGSVQGLGGRGHSQSALTAALRAAGRGTAFPFGNS